MSIAPSILVVAAIVAQPFGIEVVDEQTGRGVPLVELTTTNGITYITDSAGLVAFDEPGLMNGRVFFHVKSHGYEFPKDGFGFRGAGLDIGPGGSAKIKIRRVNIAERLYRVTGEGIYRDSVLLGRQPPIREPLLNAQVTGSDSVVTAVYRGKLHWFWGDTNRAKYPLGLFHVPGATSELPAEGGLDPSRGVDLRYFVGEDGFARATCQMPGVGPTWIFGLAALPDANGRERLLAGYMKVKQPMTVYRRGIVQWDDDKNAFQRVSDFASDAPLYSEGQPLRVRDGDVDYLYFATPYPLVRVRATVESYCDLSQYEAYTCLKSGSTIENPEIDRDEAGRTQYSWKRGTPAVGPQEQNKLIKAGKLSKDEALLQLRDAATGREVIAHAGSVYWNDYRRRFVMIAHQTYGESSFLGEVWYAEAPSPIGPWTKAVKIVTHDKYSFYNPKQHPYFDQDGGRIIYFEGTYTHTFSGNEHSTPRYDYNQVMYRLDLSDKRLAVVR